MSTHWNNIYTGLNKIWLKMYFTCFFLFFIVANTKFKIKYGAHMLFLLTRAVLRTVWITYSLLSMSSLSDNGVKKFIVKTSEREIKMCLTLKSQDHNQGSQLLIECKGKNWNPYTLQASPLHQYWAESQVGRNWEVTNFLSLVGREGTFKCPGNGEV